MNIQSKPDVSIIMPVYNVERYVEDAIKSALNQTLDNIELIIIEDRSTDNSWELVKSLENYDSRIRIIRNDRNLGLIRTRNKAIRAAKGRYIAFQDSDDNSLPQRFQDQVRYMDDNPHVGIVGCNAVVINGKGKIIDQMEFPQYDQAIRRMILTYQPFRQSALLIRKACFDQYGLMREENALDDFEFYIRFAQDWSVHNLQSFLIEYRVHGKNATIYNQKKLLRELLRIKRASVFEYGYKPTLMGFVSYALTWSMQFLPATFVLGLSNTLRKYT